MKGAHNGDRFQKANLDHLPLRLSTLGNRISLAKIMSQKSHSEWIRADNALFFQPYPLKILRSGCPLLGESTLKIMQYFAL